MKLQAVSRPFPSPSMNQPFQHSLSTFSLSFKGNCSPPGQLELPETPTRVVGWWRSWFKPIKPLDDVAESLRPNTVSLRSNNYSFNGSGVWIRDIKTGTYYILTCRHLFEANTMELHGMAEFFFGSRDPKKQQNVSGLAKIVQQYDKKDWLDELYPDIMYYNDLMLLEPTQGHGRLVSHPPQLAPSSFLGLNLRQGEPAIVCSSRQQGFIDKVEITTLLEQADIGSDFNLEYMSGKIKNGDSGSPVYNKEGDLIGILIEGNLNGDCKRGRVLNINSLRDFLERQCGLKLG